MKIRTIFLLFVLILMAVFLVINWTALSTVTAVNLIYTEIQAPLGVLVVGGFAAVVFVLLVYMVWQQASVTLELRAAYKEARNARTVADDAEKSRFAESNRILLERIEKLEALMTARSDETLTAVRQEAVRAEERYKALAANIEAGKVFAREHEQVWQCRNCGFVYIGQHAPVKCPVCAHPQSYFEVHAENY